MFGDDAEVYIRLPEQYTNVEYECYRGNTKLFNARSASAPVAEAGAHVYKGKVHLNEYTTPSLEAGLRVKVWPGRCVASQAERVSKRAVIGGARIAVNAKVCDFIPP
jgi:hypothetical protein